jgi:hypothetical protein
MVVSVAGALVGIAASVACGFVAARVPLGNATPSTLAAIYFVTPPLCAGAAQWLLLRRIAGASWAWIIVAGAGQGVMGSAIAIAGVAGGTNPTEPVDLLMTFSVVLVLLIAGTALGAVQRTLLRRRFSGTRWWIGGAALGALLGGFGALLFSAVLGAAVPGGRLVAPWVIAIGGLAAVQGYQLAYVLRFRSRRNGPISAGFRH